MVTDNTARLTSAVNSLPQLLDKKRLIDMHTTVASGEIHFYFIHVVFTNKILTKILFCWNYRRIIRITYIEGNCNSVFVLNGSYIFFSFKGTHWTLFVAALPSLHTFLVNSELSIIHVYSLLMEAHVHNPISVLREKHCWPSKDWISSNII
jgi:hypothetical protein